ncbi:hypothetical protein PsalMR5_03762 [Piscirickettsia salmonis]|uniref:hypothetical protein n=1 Tax=Piscirickettsia salmonis TaxID=1238 RepID=UPI0012BAA8AD|nr:hypothetical protein [Piscirickettsia salmonis]QGP56280.1 hypothetical protein PsalSR1_03757 [Piscirickettsia salmonis]QGP57848.1 hypothetical protein PsalBI1_00394 [Piscirickettsia salmonis]QGP65849.1 hypothetical protein PsalMR5_03762 [Piscirickettsia salmonis]
MGDLIEQKQMEAGISNLPYCINMFFQHFESSKEKYKDHVENINFNVTKLKNIPLKKIKKSTPQVNAITQSIKQSLLSIIYQKTKPSKEMYKLHLLIIDNIDYITKFFNKQSLKEDIVKLDQKIEEYQKIIDYQDKQISKLTTQKAEVTTKDYIKNTNPDHSLEVKPRLQRKEPEPNIDGEALKPRNMDSTLDRKQQISLLKQESCRQQSREAYAASTQARNSQDGSLLSEIISTLKRNPDKTQSSQMFSNYFAEQQSDQSTTSHSASPSQSN